jgi:Transposase
VDALKKACPDFARMRSLVMSFRGILQSGKTATLARWIKKANRSGIYGMNRFVRKLNHDLAAVQNALRESWSNGPVGGAHQSAEDPQAPDVRSSRLRTSYEPDCCRCSGVPPCTEIEEEPN